MIRALPTVLAGAGSGLAGGLLMGLVLLWHASSHDVDAWSPFRQIAAFWVGVEALVGDDGVVVLGVATHLAVSMALGVVFAGLTRRPSAAAAMASGLLFATVVWFVMTWVVVPIVDPVLHERIRWDPTAWFLIHLVYGAGLGATVGVGRRATPTTTGQTEAPAAT